MKLDNHSTIGTLLETTAKAYPKNPAIEFLGKYYDYETLNRITDEVAWFMVELGITLGKKVGIWASERPNTLFCFLALEKIGAIPVFLNTAWSEEEAKTALLSVEAEYLFYDEGYKQNDFLQICSRLELPCLKGKYYIGETIPSAETPVNRFVISQGNELPVDREPILMEKLQLIKSKVKPSDVDMILFTSGSTGNSKGVETTHFSRVNNARAQARMVEATDRDVYCVAIPMSHCFSMSGNILAAIAVGACISLPKSRKTEHILQAMERAKVTVLNAVPTMYFALLANKKRSTYEISSLRTGLIGGAGCSPKAFAEIEKELDFLLLPSLGMTEATAGVTVGRVSDSVEIRAKTAGYLVDGLEARIVDIHTGEILQEVRADEIMTVITIKNSVGELLIRGYGIMKGYYKNPEMTAKVISEDGFLHTGDMGYFDQAGRLYLTGRLKELIIRGGENITPTEIETAISADERVTMVKVLGVTDVHYGEEICACVQCKESSVITEDEIKQMVSKKLAYYKVPRYVVFLDKMPLLGTGKINVAELKSYVNTWIGNKNTKAVV